MHSNGEMISIVVPTKNSARTLESCLKSLQSQTYVNKEIIVVDNFSLDKTSVIAQKYADIFLQKGPERSAQRNYGVEKSSGTYVCIIDSDMILEKEVVEQCVKMFQNTILQSLVIPEESFGQGYRAQCKKMERNYYIGIHRMEAARCFRKDVFMEFGGYDSDNIGTEDFDLPQRIEVKYGAQSTGRIDAFIKHDEGRLSLRTTCKKKFYYGQRLDKYISHQANKKNFTKQANLLQRYRLFFTGNKSMQEPRIRCGMIFMKTIEMIAGGCGYLLGKLKKIDNIYR